jgi:phasin family protein
MTVDESNLTGARAKKVATASVEAAKDQFAKATETQRKAVDDLTAFSKSNMDAFVKSGTVFVQGLEQLTRTLVGATQSQVESSMSVAKSLIAAKNLTEFTELQNAFAKSWFDTAVTDATKISELAIRVANDVAEPLSARLTAAIEQVAKPVLAAA